MKEKEIKNQITKQQIIDVLGQNLDNGDRFPHRESNSIDHRVCKLSSCFYFSYSTNLLHRASFV